MHCFHYPNYPANLLISQHDFNVICMLLFDKVFAQYLFNINIILCKSNTILHNLNNMNIIGQANEGDNAFIIKNIVQNILSLTLRLHTHDFY